MNLNITHKRLSSLVRELDCLVQTTVDPVERMGYALQFPAGFEPSAFIVDCNESESVVCWKGTLRLLVSFFRTYLLCRGDVIVSVTIPLRHLDSSSWVAWCKSVCLHPSTVRNDGFAFFTSKHKRSFRQWILSRSSQKKKIFVNTCLQLKRVAGPPGDSFVKISLEKHKKQSSEQHECFQNPTGFTFELIAAIQDILKRTNFFWDPSFDIKDFSQRSCYERPMSKGGVYGYWSDSLPEGVEYSISESDTLADHPEVVATKGMKFPTRHSVFEIIKDLYLDIEWTNPNDYLVKRKIVAIKEPLKVRIIGVGHFWESPFWADYQKQLMNHIKKIIPGLLSGRQYTADDDIKPIFLAREELERLTGIEWTIVSDDGSAATDSIDPIVSDDAFAPSVPDEYKPLFSRTWNSQFQYPDGSTCIQINGQPMGDRRSFPQLCLIHYMTKVMFYKKHKLWKWIRMCKNTSILINGDDGVAVVPKQLVDSYMEFMDQLWNLNRLKTWVSDDTLSINSEYYHYLRGDCIKIPIIRWNLAYNIDKNGERSQDPSHCWNTLMEDAPDYSHNMLKRLFLREWKPELDFLKKRSPNLNYHLPMVCGGLGMKWSGDFKVTPRQYAAVAMVERYIGGNKIPPCATRRVPRDNKKIREEYRISYLPYKKFGWISEKVKAPAGNFKSSDKKKLLVSKLPRQYSGKREFDHMWSYGFGTDEQSSPFKELHIYSDTPIPQITVNGESILPPKENDELTEACNAWDRWYSDLVVGGQL